MRYLLVILMLPLILGFSCCDPEGGEEEETPLEYGFESRETYDCGESLILDAFLKVCNRYGECTKTESCARVTQELFAGTTLQAVSEPRSTYWNEFGGRGELMAESALCMLKQLANGGVTNEATARLFEVFPVTVKQKLGFLHFDPAGRLMDGYQTVSICLPIVGCFDAKESAFHAVLKQRSPAHPLGQSCGNFPVEDSFALQVTAEDMAQTLTVKIPDIRINTPYGPIYVKPRFDYYSDMHMILFPLTGHTYTRVDAEHQELHLHDVYGRIPGVNLSVTPKDVTPAGQPDNTGWMSHLALGSRQPDALSPQWLADPDHPVRPDFDLRLARNDLERKPVAGGKAEVLVTYRPPLPAALTEAPMKTDLEIMVRPTVRANFASQFDLFFNELTNSLRDSGNSLKMASALMLSNAEAHASFDIEAGIDIFMEFRSRYFTTKILDEKPRVRLVIASNGDVSSALVGAASSQHDPRFSAEPLLDGFTTPSSGAQRSPTQYVKDCVAQPIPDQPKPVAEHTPGNADILEHTQFPCNICVGHEAQSEGNTYVQAYSTLVYPSANGGPTNWTCNQYHAGCFDMCEYDSVSGLLTVTRTAVGMGLRGQPRNLACNENPPM